MLWDLYRDADQECDIELITSHLSARRYPQTKGPQWSVPRALVRTLSLGQGNTHQSNCVALRLFAHRKERSDARMIAGDTGLLTWR
jgi:hypothetical protein